MHDLIMETNHITPTVKCLNHLSKANYILLTVYISIGRMVF